MEYRRYGTYLTWQIEKLLKKKAEALSVKDIVESLFQECLEASERRNCHQRVKRSLTIHLRGRVEVEERRGSGNLIVKYYKIESTDGEGTQCTEEP